MNETATSVHRRLTTSILKEAGTIPQAVDILTRLPGIIKVTADTSGKWIRIHYDVTMLLFPQLITALEKEALVKEPAWWERFKFSLYRFQDTNIRGNATAKSLPCCSNPEGIADQCRKKNCP